VPDPAEPHLEREADAHVLSPVRYGDWEKNGIAIDF
jgi:hypothetical protein